MYEHPIVQEYLRAYEAILSFKDNLARFFLDKGTLIPIQTTVRKVKVKVYRALCTIEMLT